MPNALGGANRLVDHVLKFAVWNKGRPIVGWESSVWRHDDFGNVIRWPDYGDRQSKYGWEIDHITPVSDNGADSLFNLRPLHWSANASHSGR